MSVFDPQLYIHACLRPDLDRGSVSSSGRIFASPAQDLGSTPSTDDLSKLRSRNDLSLLRSMGESGRSLEEQVLVPQAALVQIQLNPSLLGLAGREHNPSKLGRESFSGRTVGLHSSVGDRDQPIWVRLPVRAIQNLFWEEGTSAVTKVKRPSKFRACPGFLKLA